MSFNMTPSVFKDSLVPVKRESFYDDLSYKAWGLVIINMKQLELYRQRGWWIFDSQDLIRGTFYIDHTGDVPMAGYLYDSTTRYGWFGMDTVDGKIRIRKEEVREFFSKFRMLNPNHLVKL